MPEPINDPPAETLGNAVERLLVAASIAEPGGGFVRLTAMEARALATLLEHAADGWNSRSCEELRADALAFACAYLGES